MPATFCELKSAALIALSGEQAAPFLHGQLTSDVAGLEVPRTQYSGYCSPKGRLLATFLLWRQEHEFLLQLPVALRVAIQSRLSKYVLRARVSVADATARYALFGVAGEDPRPALAALSDRVPETTHDVVSRNGIALTFLPVTRYLVLAEAERADAVSASLMNAAQQQDEAWWTRLDIEAGVPVITPETQEQFLPQMVNLDLIGGVSYTKGCYPGQEIVARTHYLGRVKQRMYRVHLAAGDAPRPGDPLYSSRFGSGQACGAILHAVAAPQGGHDALAVIQTSAVASDSLRWQSPDGPLLQLLPLPYALVS